MTIPPKTQSDIEAWLPLSSMDFLILAVLTNRDRHGYGIVKDIVSLTHGRVHVRPGNLYRVVDRLIERGFVEVKGRKETDSSSEPRRHYSITLLGLEVAKAQAELFTDVVAKSIKLSHASPLL